MLDRDNLLDIIRTFTLFSTNDKGETIKIVGRYQQFRAVKLTVKRLLDGQSPRERSGIIWHTQGSGKSLTMMFMVREMYRHARLSHWKVIFVTDRTQLEVHRKKQMPLFRMFKREIFGEFFEQAGAQVPEGAPGKRKG
jgi:type I restriction enzyme R subunit